MANNLIQILRSATNATPTGLANGQLAYTSNNGITSAGGVLYIGDPASGTTIGIGGQRFPGTLTANQALVANSTSGINNIITSNLTISGYLTANGSLGSSSQVLGSNSTGGVYWVSTSSFSINTSAQYTFTNTINFAANVFVNAAILFVGNATTNVAISTTGLVVGNATVNSAINSTAFSGSANNTTYLNGQLASYYTNATNITTGTLPYAQLPSGLVNTSGSFTFTGNTNFNAGNTAFSNGAYFGTGGTLNITNSVNTTISSPNTYFSGNNVYFGLFPGGTLTFGSTTNAVFQNPVTFDIGSNVTFKGAVTYVSNLVIYNSGGQPYLIVGNTSNQVFANATAISIGNATIVSTINSTAFSGLANNSTYLNGQLAYYYTNATNITTGTLPYAQLPSGLVNTSGSFTLSGNTVLAGTNTGISSNLQVTGTTLNVSSNSTFTGNVSITGAVSITNNVTITGNLTVTGSTITVNNTILQVNGNFIEVADNQTTTDVVDFGFYGAIANATTKYYAGLYRDFSASGGLNTPVFKFFAANVQPGSTVITTNTYFLGALQSYLQPYGLNGAFIANSTAVNITANSTVSSAIAANSLTLTSALVATSGGTGQNTYAVGDLLIGGATNTLSKLSLGTNGYVLQSNGTTVVYATLDGGSF